MGRDHNDAARAGQVAQEAEDPFHLNVVQVGRGLVGQYQRRVVHQRPGDGHPLLLPTRQLSRAVVRPLREADGVEELGGPGPGLPPRHAGQPHRHHHVAAGRQAGDQVEGLEHDTHGVAAVGGQRGATQVGHRGVAEGDVARRRAEEAGQAGEQRRLAATGGPEEHDQLAVLGREAQSVERLDDVAPGVESHGEPVDDELAAHPNAVAGSAPVTRRSAVTLARIADRDGNGRKGQPRVRGDVDRLGEHRRQQAGQHLGHDGGEQRDDDGLGHQAGKEGAWTTSRAP